MTELIPSSEKHYRFGMDEKQWVALTSVIAAIVLTITKLAVGLWTNSLGILSEALHSALDLFAAGITFFAVSKAAKPPDPDHHYGHWRVENLSALVETILLLFTVIWIIYEALRRIIFQDLVVEVNLLAFGVIIFAIIIDFSRSRALKRVGKKYDSQALEADALHFSTDILSSSVVFIGLLFTFFGFPLGDPIGAIGVAIIVLYLTFRLGRETIDILLDRAPSGLETPIRRVIEDIDGIRECGRIRLRKAGPVTFVDVVCYAEHSIPLASAHEISVKARRAVEQVVERADVVVHMGLVSKRYPSIATKVRKEAGKFDWITDVDSIDVIETEDYVVLTLDIHTNPEKSLAETHQLVSEFKKHIQSQYPTINEIITHIEPSREIIATAVGPTKIKRRIHRLVQQSPSLHNCHKLRLYSLAPHHYALTFHCEASSELSVEETHEATTLLEDNIREELPTISQITIHVEPLTEKAKTKKKSSKKVT
ncbi:MAG: cation diffusion facilitator family transporter [Candidatus Hermodarchaeota archaeon]|nr:cation diffusion facilitator family transporter [Candidatus Hermodarchaeota archaeon]